VSGTAQGTPSKSTTRQQNPRMDPSQPTFFARRNESHSSDLDANRVKEMMEAARDGPIETFKKLWSGVDLNFHVKVDSRGAELGHPQEQDARREETLRVDGKYVVCPGRTALHMAVANGQEEIVRFICGVRDVRVNIKDKFGYTPLHMACHSPASHGAVIDMLLGSNIDLISANANEVSNNGETPLHFAVRGKFKRAVEKLLEWKPRAGQYYNSTIDVGVKSNEGETPLLLALHKRNSEKIYSQELTWIVRTLISHIKTNCRENINQIDHERKSAIHISIESEDYGLIDLILEEWGYHVNLGIKDSEGKSAWEVAFQQPRYYVIDILVHSNIDFNFVNANEVSKNGETPLHFAVRSKFTRAVDRLLEWKPSAGEYYNRTIDVSVKSNAGVTPLLLAVHSRIGEKFHSEELRWIIRRLIRHIKTNCPENINQTDHKRKSAIHISIEYRDYELMNLILEEGGDKVNLDIKDSEGKSAWEVACQQPHYAVVCKLQNYLERVGLYGNPEAYAGAANAILVVAALLATVTFNAWSLITVAESTLFWVFSSLSFLFAISTLLAAAGAALPSRGSTIADIRNTIHAASFCLAISISCAIGAFATAAFHYAPSIKYKRRVIVTIAIGGIFCLNFLVGFVRRLARAYSPIFLYTDFRSREFLYKHIITPVERWLMGRKFVVDLKHWYYRTIINPAEHPGSRMGSLMGDESSIPESNY
jgi:ankyrin repeat protein